MECLAKCEVLAWVLPLRVWHRRIVFRLPRSVHQLINVLDRRQLWLVLEEHGVEGSERVLLVRGCFFSLLCSILMLPRSLFLSRSCFNAFSRVDVRVDVKIPGGVVAYVIDLRGERCVGFFGWVVLRIDNRRSHDTTPELWQETYLSAILRAILYGDDSTYWLEAYRRLDPVTSYEDELHFLEAAEALFLQGLSTRWYTFCICIQS